VLPTMRKTSYAVTFLLVTVSLTLNLLAITRTDWYSIFFLNLTHSIMPFIPGSSIQDESSFVPVSMSTMAF